MIKKQLKAIIILLVAAILLGVGYMVAKPFLTAEEQVEKKTVDADGDTLGIADRPYIYDVIPSEALQSIYVKNSHGEYKFNMDPYAKSLVLEGKELLHFDAEKLSYLYVNTCNMLAMTKVENPSSDLSEYGLPDGKSETYFTVTEKDGRTHTVYLGSLLPTGAAYYCKSADKPFIYVIDTMIEDCVLNDASIYVTPVLASPISQEERYAIDNIRIVRDGKLFVSFECADESEKSDDGAAISHIMKFPGGYNASQTVVDTILSKLTSFVGSKTVEYDIPTDSMEEIFGAYGFTAPSAELLYNYKDKEHRIIFGNKTEDGTECYVLNLDYRTVSTVALEDIPFMQYDLIKFIDEYIFQMDINKVKSVSVSDGKHSETFDLTGEKAELKVTKRSSGEVVDTRNFRQFYIDVLLVNMEDYAESPETPHEILSYTIESRSGKVYEYRFYDLSTRKVFFTVNGVGQFYANRDTVEIVISNLDKLIKGETITSQALS